MQKSKLGISVGLLCAILYFSYLLNSIIISLAIIAYILIVEENIWLKKSAVKSIVLCIAISVVVPFVISLIPQIFDLVNDLLNIFDVYLYDYDFFNIVNDIFGFFNNIVFFVEKVLFVALGALALKQSTIKVPFVDDVINKYMD